MKIVLASRNKKKIAELQTLLGEYIEGIEILSLDDVGILGEIEENGNSFSENALIKARAAAESLPWEASRIAIPTPIPVTWISANARRRPVCTAMPSGI